MVKGITFPYGLVKSRKLVLLPQNYSKDYYFVSDFWTTTRYPKTREGLLSAKRHIVKDRQLNKKMFGK